MKEINNSPACPRSSDLIAFLYNEANEREVRDFEHHLKECRVCEQELTSFGEVRESVTAWRDEALSGFVSTPLATAVKRKSALAALRQFFDLSPLWLKGATSLAVVTFCVLAVLAGFRVQTNDNDVSSTEQVYTQQDVDRLVKEALAKEVTPTPPTVVDSPATVVVAHPPKRKKNATGNHVAKSRRPLSRAEREQLAADLRLLSTPDGADLNLLGDRINQ